MELGPEDVSLLERCSHFRGWYDGCLIPTISRRSVVVFGSWNKRPEGSSSPWKPFITAPLMMVGELVMGQRTK